VPELPEVETIRARLAPLLEGRRLAAVRIDDARLTRPNDPAEVASQMRGERITTVDRRGKYLIFRFESGRSLLIHLRMTGSLLHRRNGSNGSLAEDPYQRAVLRLDNGSDVAYRDVRRFGTWLLLEQDEIAPYLEVRLGVEPLADAFTPEALVERLAGRRAPVKAALLDQRTVAGMGNIYADEALWRAEIDPRRTAGALHEAEVERMHAGIKAALAAGIARQGATLRDYRTPDGQSGGMQLEFQVYGREGEPCLRCGTPIAKTRIAGRGTSYCPGCQH
jgi:formamidopyrimidine-DNA glycosylase